jgi:hypothetical protein
MPNNINALPSSGAISLQDIADAFYLYKSYSDGLSATIHNYYGDLIKYYSPFSPKLPLTTDVTINIDPFHGKRFAFPVPLVASGNNYNVFDQANAYTIANYGFKLNTPGIPFDITVTNNSNIGSTAISAPGLTTGSAVFSTPGTYAWVVPANVTTINILAVGGGGGGGGGGASQVPDGSGGGGGGGGQVTTINSISVTAGTSTTVVVGSGGSAGSYTGQGNSGGVSKFTISATTYSANGGGGGFAWAPGTGGLAGGTGGSSGGAGSQTSGGGRGGITLVSSYGTGGNGGGGAAGGDWVAAGNTGSGGKVIITYATKSSASKNTQNTAAMVIGTSSDGTATFNDNTNTYLINNGTITGPTDITGQRSPGSPFTVNEGQTYVSYTISGGGGSGGAGSHADGNGPGAGKKGGYGQSISGKMPVSQGDTVSFAGGGGGSGGGGGGNGVINRNGIAFATAAGGGGGGTPSYSGGGEGGAGGGYTDGGRDGTPGNGLGGSASVNYIPNIPGGPALYITKPTSITGGVVTGGKSSSGVVGSGYSIIGKQYVNFTTTNTTTVNGSQINL